MNTDCSKCKAPMPELPKPNSRDPISLMSFKITAYLCKQCGHWNNLKRRKGWSAK